jgi:energy-converting hydrogenase Eha subunit A
VGWAATVWATAFPDPLMLIGIPVVAGSWWGMRAIYAAIRGSLQDRLESLLDRLEHGELK